MTYKDLIKSVNIKCPECGDLLEIDVDVDTKLDHQTKKINSNVTVSPILRCQNKENCGATFRPSVILNRSLENINIKFEVKR